MREHTHLISAGFRLIAISWLCLAGSACDSVEDETLHTGLVSFGFEVSAFQPCGENVQWWIIGSQNAYTELQDAYNNLGVAGYTKVYARLRGNPGAKKGSYGHLGAYEREFDVTQVVEVRMREENECE